MGDSLPPYAARLAAGGDSIEGLRREAACAAGDIMTGFILRALISAVGLWIATRVVSGILIDDAFTLVLAGALLGIVNAIVRPVAILLTLPITILTLGLFLLVVNAGMVALVAAL